MFVNGKNGGWDDWVGGGVVWGNGGMTAEAIPPSDFEFRELQLHGGLTWGGTRCAAARQRGGLLGVLLWQMCSGGRWHVNSRGPASDSQKWQMTLARRESGHSIRWHNPDDW